MSKKEEKIEESLLQAIIDEFKRADLALPIGRCHYFKNLIAFEIKKAFEATRVKRYDTERADEAEMVFNIAIMNKEKKEKDYLENL